MLNSLPFSDSLLTLICSRRSAAGDFGLGLRSALARDRWRPRDSFLDM